MWVGVPGMTVFVALLTSFLLCLVWGQINFVRCEGTGAPRDFFHSVDGVTWVSTSTVFSDPSPTSGCRDVCFSPDLNVWVATGLRSVDSSRLAFSRDGIGWTLVLDNALAGNEGRACAWGADKFLAVGDNGAFAWSWDGMAWSGGSEPSVRQFNGLAYSNQQRQWVAAVLSSNQAGFVTSANGLSWSAPVTIPGNGYMADVAWSPSFNIWAFSGTVLGAFQFYNWNGQSGPLQVSSAVGLMPVSRAISTSLIALDGGGFLGLIGNTNEVWSSADGVSWLSKSALASPSNASRGICAIGSIVVAMGFSQTAQSPIAVFSSNSGASFAVADATSTNVFNANIGSVASRTFNLVGASFSNGSFVVAVGVTALVSSAFATVPESLSVLGTLQFGSSGFVSINKTLICGNGSAVLLDVGPGVNSTITLLLASFSALSGRFSTVRSTTQSLGCFDTEPLYSATTFSVIVSPAKCGLPAPAIIGACIGATFFASVVVVGIVLWMRRRIGRHDAMLNAQIRGRHLDEFKSDYHRIR